jgi:membrane fusion protein
MDGTDQREIERTSLFREEAMEAGRTRWLGTVVMTPPISHTLLTALAVVLAFGVAGLLAFGEFSRKARLGGWLSPERGLIHVVPPQAGVLTQLTVSEGQQVASGDPIGTVSAELRSEAVGATQVEIVRQLRARRESLEAERAELAAIAAAQQAALDKRLAAIDAEAAALEGEFTLQRARTDLAQRALVRQRELNARALTVEINVQAAEESALDQALALQALERTRATLLRERLEVEAARQEGPNRTELERAALGREIATVEQELALAEAQRQIVLTAPAAGVITAVQASSGANVGPEAPILIIVPADAHLEARLYGPSRAIGFVRPGQRVLLRYEAFPFQKFGQYTGVVGSVSRSTVGPGELGAAAAAIPDLEAPNEPVYRVTVTLDSQTVTAYGETVPLQAGMRLEADILIETRRVYEWLLDPLRALAGRVST